MPGVANPKDLDWINHAVKSPADGYVYFGLK